MSEAKVAERSVEEIHELLRTMPIAYLSDAFTRLKLDGCRMVGLRPLFPFEIGKTHMAGPAVTMKFVPATHTDSYMESPHHHTEIFERSNRGDIVVIDGESALHVAFLGGVSGATAVRTGLVGIVVDGALRDVDEIAPLNLPAYSKGVCMRSYVGEFDCFGYNIPITCAGARVRPGDTVVGDNMGVVVIPKEFLTDVITAALDIASIEEDIFKYISEGRSWKEIYPQLHVRKYVAQD
jgi:4-hydroxy-4-methyl-2-oxoglutarate aldolase